MIICCIYFTLLALIVVIGCFIRRFIHHLLFTHHLFDEVDCCL